MLLSGYTGRGVAVGRTARGEWVVAYWITARSESSQNRVLVRRGNELATTPSDESLPFDPQHTIYPAMRWTRDYVVAANGAHTLDIDAALTSGRDWRRALRARSYEGDAPYYTPRIAGVLRFHDHAPRITLAKVVRVPGSELASHAFYEYADMPEGSGIALHTHEGGNEPRTNTSDPELIDLGADAEQIGERIWSQLDPLLVVAVAAHVFGTNGVSRDLWFENARPSVVPVAAGGSNSSARSAAE